MDSDPPQDWAEGMPMIPAVELVNCPIAAGLGVLGKKWTLLILRDISMRKEERFSELRKSVEGITNRVLSMRLRELEAEGLIEKVENRESPRFTRWNLTKKGWDAVPILMSLVAYGSKWYAQTVFRDGEPREIREVYPQPSLSRMYVNLDVDRVAVKSQRKQSGF
jgi:DNA-binding HxlR family transcriptional regulator